MIFRQKSSVYLNSMTIFRALIFLLLISVILPVAAHEIKTPDRVHRTPVFTEMGTEDCLRCHSGDKMRAVQASPHLDPDYPQAPATAHGCESCHGPGSIHISRAHGGQGFPPLITFGRGKDVSPRDEQLHACLSCHALEDTGGETIGFIGSPHDRRTINCSTCHKVHAENDPMNDRENQAKTCNRCHRKHMESHPRFEDKSIDFDALSCGTCHDVHAAAAELD